jgi:predicted nucleic acid-binding protein
LAVTYDAQYVALAEMLGCDLWTADLRLVDTLRAALHFVRWIGDYQPRSG